MANSKKIPLQGTEHTVLPGARAIGPTDPHQLIEISLVLKHRQSLPKPENKAKLINHTDFAGTYGADPAQVTRFASLRASATCRCSKMATSYAAAPSRWPERLRPWRRHSPST